MPDAEVSECVHFDPDEYPALEDCATLEDLRDALADLLSGTMATPRTELEHRTYGEADETYLPQGWLG